MNNIRFFLWSLKFGALVNLYFLGRTFSYPLVSTNPQILIPARIIFVVSAFRCLFPVRYKNNIVFHKSPLSSVFLTRVLATFSEVALIYQLAWVIRALNIPQVSWVNVFSWVMVVQVVVSQFFVWGSILTGRLMLFFYEELGWALIYAANTIASAYLYVTVDNFGGRELLILLNLLFGAVYLPWQFIHLRVLRLDALRKETGKKVQTKLIWNTLARGLHLSIHVKNPTSESQAWGGIVGVIWMASYWAVLIPVWVYLIIRGI